VNYGANCGLGPAELLSFKFQNSLKWMNYFVDVAVKKMSKNVLLRNYNALSYLANDYFQNIVCG
jgi:hypothetical protein